MNTSLFEFINSLETPFLEALLQKHVCLPPDMTALVSETLHRRSTATALREKYPREKLEKMSCEQLETLLWTEILNKSPAWLNKGLLRDIFEIQDNQKIQSE